MITLDQVLGASARLPTISAVTLELAQLIRDQRASASDFESVIRRDPALAAELLRLANSAYFHLPREVKSIKQAVALLGTRRLFDLATAASMSRTIPAVLPGYQVEASSFFCHCAAVGIIAGRLAQEVGRHVPDMVFAAGLLHDLGKLAVGGFLQENQSSLARELAGQGEDIIQAERSVLGVDHAQVGGALAHRWNFPMEVERAVTWHHSPDSAGPDGEGVVDLVHAADVLAHMLGYGADVGGLLRRVAPGAVDRLGITAKGLETVAAATVEDILDMTRAYRSRGAGNSAGKA